MLPKQLVDHQKQMAAARQAQTVTLPPHLVEEIFLPKPVQQPTYTQYEIPPQPARQTPPQAPPQALGNPYTQGIPSTQGNPSTQGIPTQGYPTPPGNRPNGIQQNPQYEGYINIPHILSA